MTDYVPTRRQMEILGAWYRLRRYDQISNALLISHITVRNTLATLRRHAGVEENRHLVKVFMKPMLEVEGVARTYKTIRYRTDSAWAEQQRKKAREGMRRLRAIRSSERLGAYARLYAEQDGRCAICGKHESDQLNARTGVVRKLAVDHDHQSEEIRGLLCTHCNVMLGNAGDDPNRLEAAAKYLRRYAQRTQHKSGGEAA